MDILDDMGVSKLSAKVFVREKVRTETKMILPFIYFFYSVTETSFHMRLLTNYLYYFFYFLCIGYNMLQTASHHNRNIFGPFYHSPGKKLSHISQLSTTSHMIWGITTTWIT